MLGQLCLLLGLSFLWFGVLSPLHRHRVQQQAARMRRSVRDHQTLAVRHYYPGLRKLTPSELRELYDVEGAYHRIGKTP